MMTVLPQKPGWNLVHTHDEGYSCNLDGNWPCRYEPTPARGLLSRIVEALTAHRWDKPKGQGWCNHAPDLASSCLTCRAAR